MQIPAGGGGAHLYTSTWEAEGGSLSSKSACCAEQAQDSYSGQPGWHRETQSWKTNKQNKKGKHKPNNQKVERNADS